MSEVSHPGGYEPGEKRAKKSGLFLVFFVIVIALVIVGWPRIRNYLRFLASRSFIQRRRTGRRTWFFRGRYRPTWNRRFMRVRTVT
jgi:hypothetical protein